MTAAAPIRSTHHLFPAFLALLLAGGTVGAVLAYARTVIYFAPLELATDAADARLQGVALQREAFSRADTLVLYGSSELVKPMANMPTEFYATKRSGFGVFAVGKPGAASLNVLQRIGGVGAKVEGRKLAFYISPGWFFTEIFDPKYYEGNFSEMQALEVLFSSELSHQLRHDIAVRLGAFPNTLEGRDLLAFAVHRLASDKFMDRVQLALAWPVAKVNNAIAVAQDEAEVAFHMLDAREKTTSRSVFEPETTRARILRVAAARLAEVSAVNRKRSEVAKRRLMRGPQGKPVGKVVSKDKDRAFKETIQKAREWTDFELLLRTLSELKAEPLLLAMPVENLRLEAYEVSEDVRAVYTERLHNLTTEYKFPLRDFPEQQGDPAFTVDFQDHPSPKGWRYLNDALDDFYHNRTSSPDDETEVEIASPAAEPSPEAAIPAVAPIPATPSPAAP